jgi:hypothetical protein
MDDQSHNARPSRRCVFTYELDGHGWCSATLTSGDLSFSVGASYLSDALGDLIDAINALLAGCETSHCTWEGEPGEWRWLFGRRDDEIGIRVLEFPDTFSRAADEQGKNVFEMTCDIWHFAYQVRDQLANVLTTFGEEGYRQRWHAHPFPASAYNRLQALLDEHRRTKRSGNQATSLTPRQPGHGSP